MSHNEQMITGIAPASGQIMNSAIDQAASSFMAHNQNQILAAVESCQVCQYLAVSAPPAVQIELEV